MSKFFLVSGSVAGGTAVVLGALGAHALKSQLDEHLLSVFITAVEYQMYHAIALLFVGVISHLFSGHALIRYAGVLILAGIVLFCGGLYGLVFTQLQLFGLVAPLGGFAFIAGWIVLAWGCYRVV